ncbi:protein lap4 isoform X3 [Halyomorpha halys]|uniref:protein lap4 isoform X3 n=1 Tax=Halyomorpha halys TaxID=286706 RepID=UPI0006D4CC0D|nr:protein lap4 isoform X3 [Halyomorpha halys]
MFRCIPIFKGCNRQVECVDKRHSSLPSVPEEILRYSRSLEELLLDANHIRDLPKNFFRLHRLRKLGLSDNEIHRLPPDIQNFENLVELDVSRNDIQDLPENIKNLRALQVADFSSNPISRLPPGFVQLKNLATLALNDMSLTYLPDDFGLLSSLKSLELRENLLQSLPESLSQLSALERLDLGDNEIEELPRHIGKLPALQELWLDHNQIKHLPSEIGELKNLTCLDVSENKLLDLPDEIGGLDSLTDLHLSQNMIETLPDGIGFLRKLTILKVDQNRLETLNPNIGKCENLQELILTENFLVELPLTIGNLVNLTNLNVDRNSLHCIPPEIGRLAKLGVLSLRDNKLQYIPSEVGNCSLLHVLDLSGNRLEYLPITLTNLELKAVWLSKNQSQPLLTFQTDVDERTGEQVLTCFLLPQLEPHHDMSQPGRVNRAFDGVVRVPIEAGAQSEEDEDGWEEREASRAHSVKFTEDVEAESGKETPFVRQNTPHPKELKAKAHKLFNKSKLSDNLTEEEEPKLNDSKGSFRSERLSSAEIDASSERNSLTYSESTLPRETEIVKELNKNGGVKVGNDVRVTSDSPSETGQSELEDDEEQAINKKKEDEVSEKLPAAPAPPPMIPNNDMDDDLCEEMDGRLDIREERLEVRLEKTQAGLGLSIAGGLGSTPFKGDDEGIFVSKVTEGGPADKVDLRVGDKIISVNGHSMTGIGHHEAVNVLRTIGPVLHIVIDRETAKLRPIKSPSPLHDRTATDSPSSTLSRPSSSISNRDSSIGLNGPTIDSKLSQLKRSDYDVQIQTIHTTLIRDQNGLGFSIAGGKGSPQYKENSDAIYISRITEGGVAEKDGKLQVGDRIISINGIDVDGARHDQAVTMLTCLERFVRLVAEREVFVPKGTLSPATSSPKLLVGGPKPYTSIYNTNRYSGTPLVTAGSPQASANRTASPQAVVNRTASPQTPVNRTASPPVPRPAPRRTNSQTSDTAPVPNTAEERSSAGSGLPPRNRPMTNEDFQALIPAKFLNRGGGSGSEDGSEGSSNATTVKLTIKNPDPAIANGIQFPEDPKGLGKVTETITKSTFTETVVTRVTDNKLAESYIIEEVILVKDGGSLGFSIIGGTDHSCIPFGGDKPGIFISHIVAGGIAAASGKLRMGDRLLEVNGEDLTKCRHDEAVMALLKPTEHIKLLIQHDPLPEGFQVLSIVREEAEKLGMHIKGGLRGHRGNPLDKSDEGVFISKINSGGAAKRDGRLKVGMRLLEVNGVSLLGKTHQDAVNTLRTAGLRINLIVCKGYDKAEVDRLMSEGILSKETKSASHSVSSLDREEENSESLRQEEELKDVFEPEKEEIQKPIVKEVISTELVPHTQPSDLQVEEHKSKSTPEKVMEVVRAAEILAQNDTPASPTAKPKSPKPESVKTTTIVMSKHTLAPQPTDQLEPSADLKPQHDVEKDKNNEQNTVKSLPLRSKNITKLRPLSEVLSSNYQPIYKSKLSSNESPGEERLSSPPSTFQRGSAVAEEKVPLAHPSAKPKENRFSYPRFITKHDASEESCRENNLTSTGEVPYNKEMSKSFHEKLFDNTKQLKSNLKIVKDNNNYMLEDSSSFVINEGERMVENKNSYHKEILHEKSGIKLVPFNNNYNETKYEMSTESYGDLDEQRIFMRKQSPLRSPNNNDDESHFRSLPTNFMYHTTYNRNALSLDETMSNVKNEKQKFKEDKRHSSYFDGETYKNMSEGINESSLSPEEWELIKKFRAKGKGSEEDLLSEKDDDSIRSTRSLDRAALRRKPPKSVRFQDVEKDLHQTKSILRTSLTEIPSPSKVEMTTIPAPTVQTNPTISCNVNIPLHLVSSVPDPGDRRHYFQYPPALPLNANNPFIQSMSLPSFYPQSLYGDHFRVHSPSYLAVDNSSAASSLSPAMVDEGSQASLQTAPPVKSFEEICKEYLNRSANILSTDNRNTVLEQSPEINANFSTVDSNRNKCYDCDLKSVQLIKTEMKKKGEEDKRVRIDLVPEHEEAVVELQKDSSDYSDSPPPINYATHPEAYRRKPSWERIFESTPAL